MAISRSAVKIAIMPVDTNASTIASSDWILGEIKNYSKSGGERDVESDPHFGGFVDKEKPVSQVELSFDVTPSLTSPIRWESLAYGADGSNPTVYTMASEPADKAVFIEASTSAGVQSLAFNNCNVTMLDFDHSADDNRTGTLGLKFSPTDESGTSNFMASSVVVSSLPNWSALD